MTTPAGTLHAGIVAAADRLAATLTDPNHIAHPGPRKPVYNLAYGDAGIALLHTERARHHPQRAALAHTWLKQATSTPVAAAGSADIFTGAPAIGHLLTVAAAATAGYTRALEAIDTSVEALTRARLDAAKARIKRGDGLRMHEYDLVHGLTGLGVYHLNRHPEAPLTRAVLSYLIDITLHTPPNRDRPAWWAVDATTGRHDPVEFPHGHGNLGVSHGVSGPLALLSHAALRGLEVPGAKDAIAEICAWIDQWRQDLPHGGSWWPGYLTIDNLHTHTVAPTQQPRPSWCYGISGIARAQQLAGLALADRSRQAIAETAMLTAIRSGDQAALGTEHGLCHGLAGMVQAAARMAADSLTGELADELPSLAAALTADPENPGLDPGLMEGTAGIALALHSLHTETDREATAWDAFLLLS